MSTLRYFNTAWMSKFDGPGVRTVVFFQGCNLRCQWCHSPHSWEEYSPILLNPNMCTLCGRCVFVCKQNVHKIIDSKHIIESSKCEKCGQCIESCPNSSENSNESSLMLPTKETSVSNLFSLLKPQLNLVKRIGGITLSGGEALLQLEAAKELLSMCKNGGIHTAVETNTSLPINAYKYVSDLVDCWLVGIRAIEEKDDEFTVFSEKIEFFSSLSKEIIIRTPIICGYTDSKEQINTIITLMKKYNLKYIELLPYNSNTPHYYKLLGVDFNIGENVTPSKEYLEKIKANFEAENIIAKIL